MVKEFQDPKQANVKSLETPKPQNPKTPKPQNSEYKLIKNLFENLNGVDLNYMILINPKYHYSLALHPNLDPLEHHDPFNMFDYNRELQQCQIFDKRENIKNRLFRGRSSH